ncbi:MAG: hypothetical protein EOO28_04510 [Comamonadaceae bacterium]|nr:MAG: hypothetical protein EOO28_04510 [Comamonadaceae bacterium]
MDSPYTVTLQGMDDLPSAERMASEIRFIRQLEKALGGADGVLSVYGAWRDASESEPGELSAATSSLAIKWPKAFDAAQRAGLKNIGESEAHFEMRVERSVAG